ncbi:MAG: glycosyltransferase family 4 protein, partial [Odoribacter sp.]
VIRGPVIPRGSGKGVRLFLNYLSYLLMASWCAFLLSFREKFDRIFVHETSPVTVGIPAVIMKWRQKIPLYFWVLDLWPESLSAAGGVNNKYVLSFFRYVVCFLYKYSDKILISSKGFEQSILEKGDYSKKVVYFPNWGEDVFIKSTLSQIPDLPAGFRIMYAGNIGEAQGFETMMEAALLLKEFFLIKWIFIGDGRKRKYIEDFVQQNDLKDNVFILGRFPLEKMPSFFAQADVLILSLKDEMIFNLTVPAKLQAYMAAAKPVCAVLNGEGAAIVREACNGYAVAAGDTNGLVEQIMKFSNCPSSELEKLGKNGLKYYNKYFRKDICMNNLCRIMNL